MKAVVQRVSSAEVSVTKTNRRRSTGRGLLVLLGVGEGDTRSNAAWMARKIANLRIFEDAGGKMNLPVKQACSPPAVLLVSQFTLLADCLKGNRPGFARAAKAETAIPLYEHVAESLSGEGVIVETGVFGAGMEVSLVNEGPVTVVLESPGGE